MISKVKVRDIRVIFEKRDLGNIESLAKSIKKHGLLHHITVNHDYELLAGRRRLEAVKALGWEEIECNVVDTKGDGKNEG